MSEQTSIGRVKFYLDEHVDLDIAKALRRRGIDVTTAQEENQREPTTLSCSKLPPVKSVTSYTPCC